MALNMRPSNPIFYAGYYVLPYAVISAYYRLGSFVIPYCANILIGKFRHWASLASVSSSKYYGVLHIVFARSPFQVFDCVIRARPVLMAAINVSRLLPNKRGENKAMDGFLKPFVFFTQGNHEIPVRGGVRKHDKAFKSFWPTTEVFNNAFIASYSPETRSRVQAFKVRDWLPNFHCVTPKIWRNFNTKGNIQWL